MLHHTSVHRCWHPSLVAVQGTSSASGGSGSFSVYIIRQPSSYSAAIPTTKTRQLMALCTCDQSNSSTMLHAYFGDADWVMGFMQGFIQGFIHSNLNTKSRTARTPCVKYITKVLQVWSSMVQYGLENLLHIVHCVSVRHDGRLQSSEVRQVHDAALSLLVLSFKHRDCKCLQEPAQNVDVRHCWSQEQVREKEGANKTRQGHKGMLRNTVLKEYGDTECAVLSSDPLLSQDPRQL